jgi:Tol biopolymer transport system component
VYSRASFAGAPFQEGVYILDLASRRARFLEGSEGLMEPAWSPDGRYIAAHRDREQLLLFDLRTGHWTPLASGAGMVGVFWSRDGKYVYYQEEFRGADQRYSA